MLRSQVRRDVISKKTAQSLISDYFSHVLT